MKYINTVKSAVVVLAAIFSANGQAAPVSYDQSWGDSVEAAHQDSVALFQDHQNQITANKITTDQQATTLLNRINDTDADLNSTKDGVLIINQKVDDNANKAEQEIKAANDYTSQVQAQSNAADSVQDNRLTTLENLPKPKDGVDGAQGLQGDKGDIGATGATGMTGANGKDGVTTTLTTTDNTALNVETKQRQNDVAGLTKAQSDAAKDAESNSKLIASTGATVAANSQHIDDNSHAISTTNKQVSSVASQTASNSQAISKMNNQFNSLKNQVDDNRKEANAGISGAVAQANIPQVTQNQTFSIGAGVGGYNSENALAVGASAHLSENVIVKASVSDDTQSNIGYGAGVALGF